MSSRIRRFIPRLVALDDRSLPSVSAAIVPGTTVLQITGDDTANTVQVTEDASTGVITVTADGATQTFAAAAVDSIVVNSFGGNDVVEFDLTGPQATTMLVSVDLGKGADLFTANVSPQISGSGTNVGISATGDGGGDTLVLNVSSSTTVAPDSRLSVDYSGQAGHDSITFSYDPGLLINNNVTLTKDQKH